MSAIRLARAATGRKLIVKFEGCYHGHADGLARQSRLRRRHLRHPRLGRRSRRDRAPHARSALQRSWRRSRPPSPRIPATSPPSSSSPSSATPAAFRPRPGYLAGLRALTAQRRRAAHRRRGHDRLSRGPRRRAASSTRSIPTSSLSAKLSAEACPSASSAGNSVSWICLRRLGRFIRPERSAATRSPWPPASPPSAICRSTPPKSTRSLEATSKAVAEGVAQRSRPRRRPAHHQPRRLHVDLVLHAGPGHQLRSRPRKSDTAAFGRFHRAMLEQGIWLPPSQFEAAFLSTAHGDAEVQATIAAARAAFESARPHESSAVLSRTHASSVTNRCVVFVLLEISLSAAVTDGCAIRARVVVTAVVQHDVRSAARASAADRSSSSSCAAIRSADGSLQSEVIAFHSTGFRPSSRAMRNTAGRRAPNGGRKNFTGAARDLLQRFAGALQFLANRSCAAPRQVRMRPRVISDQVPCRRDPPHQFRLRLRTAAQQKERCPHIVLRQNIQQPRRPLSHWVRRRRSAPAHRAAPAQSAPCRKSANPATARHRHTRPPPGLRTQPRPTLHKLRSQ